MKSKVEDKIFWSNTINVVLQLKTYMYCELCFPKCIQKTQSYCISTITYTTMKSSLLYSFSQ